MSRRDDAVIAFVSDSSARVLPPHSANREFYIRMLDTTCAKNQHKYENVHVVGYLQRVPPVHAAPIQPSECLQRVPPRPRRTHTTR